VSFSLWQVLSLRDGDSLTQFDVEHNNALELASSEPGVPAGDGDVHLDVHLSRAGQLLSLRVHTDGRELAAEKFTEKTCFAEPSADAPQETHAAEEGKHSDMKSVDSNEGGHALNASADVVQPETLPTAAPLQLQREEGDVKTVAPALAPVSNGSVSAVYTRVPELDCMTNQVDAGLRVVKRVASCVNKLEQALVRRAHIAALALTNA
jgi:hypothetical protein